jgi:hypothetical protein
MWMIRIYGLFQDSQRALVERLGLCVLALGVVQLREVVQADSHVWSIRTDVALCHFQCLFCHGHSTLVVSYAIKLHDLIIEGIPFIKPFLSLACESRGSTATVI